MTHAICREKVAGKDQVVHVVKDGMSEPKVLLAENAGLELEQKKVIRGVGNMHVFRAAD